MGDTHDIKNAAANFLLGQKSERWSFNYLARGATRENAGLPHPAYPPYPDDMDDTFAALSALVRYDAGVIDGHAAAAIAKLLIAREAREGGPYRTWLIGDDAAAAWQDVDLVVNSTIGYFLSLIGVRLSRLEDFIDNAVRENRLSSPYYPGTFHVGYFLSRFYKIPTTLMRSTAARRAKYWQTPSPRAFSKIAVKISLHSNTRWPSSRSSTLGMRN